MNADLQIAVIGHPDSHAAIYRRPGRIVGFLRSVDGAVLRVLSLLVEVSGTHEGVDPRRELVLQPERKIAEVDGCVLVNEPALGGRDDRVAVGT